MYVVSGVADSIVGSSHNAQMPRFVISPMTCCAQASSDAILAHPMVPDLSIDLMFASLP